MDFIEKYTQIDDITIYVRHNKLSSAKPTLLFLHGLGDSGLAFEQVFQQDQFEGFNLIVCDLPGYGRSSRAKDYSFNVQVKRLWALITFLENSEIIRINNLGIVAHSMGAIPAVLMCQTDRENIIKRLALVEGTISPYGSSIPEIVSQLSKKEFELWFEIDYLETVIQRGLLPRLPFSKHYHASLVFCDRKAFRDNAKEMKRKLGSFEDEEENQIGPYFAGLHIPRLYFYATHSIPLEVKEFLNRNHIPAKELPYDSHFLMSENPPDFYKHLYKFFRTEPEVYII
ncbi:MAG: alpha/beta fold hydrolase [Vulcanimicrobiota bacterium]